MCEQRVHKVCAEEGGARLCSGDEKGAFCPRFACGGGDGGNAGGASHDKKDKGDGRRRAHGGGQIRSVKEGEHSCHVFFGDESRNGGQSHLPLRDSHRIEEIHECAAGNGEHTLSAFRADIAEGEAEREQRPACHEKGQHHRGDFYYKLFEGK